MTRGYYIDECGSSSTSVWPTWTDQTASTFSHTTSTWTAWTGGTTSAGSSTCDDTAGNIWIRWALSNEPNHPDQRDARLYGNWNYGQRIATLVETPEQKVERLEREKIAAEKRAEEQKRLAEEAKVREEKAWQFLVAVLTAQQKEELEKKAYFELVSVNSGKRYRIHKGQTRNIRGLHDGKVIESLCFHPIDDVHDYDAMAIQKLALEYDEEGARKVANIRYH